MVMVGTKVGFRDLEEEHAGGKGRRKGGGFSREERREV